MPAVLEPVVDVSEPDIGELVQITVDQDPVDTNPEPAAVEPDSVAAVSAATYAMPAEYDAGNDCVMIDIVEQK